LMSFLGVKETPPRFAFEKRVLSITTWRYRKEGKQRIKSTNVYWKKRVCVEFVSYHIMFLEGMFSVTYIVEIGSSKRGTVEKRIT
jgi:hypothetical protein